MKNNILWAALLIALGIAAAGSFIYSGMRQNAQQSRFVSVRGLSEREVPADKVTWPVYFKEVGNDLQALYRTVNAKNAKVVAFLKSKGLSEQEISVAAPAVIDLDAERYRSSDSPYRYNVTSVITVTSKQVDKVREMMLQQGELLQQGMHADEFAKAMAGVTPLTKAGRDVVPPVEPKPFAGTSGNALQDFMDGKLEFAISFTDEYMEGFVVGLDPVMMQKLRQGSFSPEAHVDLHGLNTQQAFETLRGFFKGSWYRGLRCVIVVCGRGKNSPDGIGILREKLQLWFTQEPFKRVILAFCTAKSHDGGAGAVYVLMRKYKKKGHIAWERMPADEDLL